MPSPCSLEACLTVHWRVLYKRFRKGGESLRVRTWGGKSELQRARCRVTSPLAHAGALRRYMREQGRYTFRRTVPQRKYRRRNCVSAVRVKRRGKSPPLRE